MVEDDLKRCSNFIDRKKLQDSCFIADSNDTFTGRVEKEI